MKRLGLSLLLCAWPISVAYAAQPSLHLEGKGYITACAPPTCSSAIDATLSGIPYGESSLHIDLSVRAKPERLTGCYLVKGAGTLTPTGGTVGSIAVVFHGQQCAERATFVGQRIDNISGSIGIYQTSCLVSSQASTGTLDVFGSYKFEAPFPYSNETVVSILGSSTQIQFCNP